MEHKEHKGVTGLYKEICTHLVGCPILIQVHITELELILLTVPQMEFITLSGQKEVFSRSMDPFLTKFNFQYVRDKWRKISEEHKTIRYLCKYSNLVWERILKVLKVSFLILHQCKFKLCNLILHLILKPSLIKLSESKIIIVYRNEHLNSGSKINHTRINVILKGQNQPEMLHRKSEGEEAPRSK